MHLYYLAAINKILLIVYFLFRNTIIVNSSFSYNLIILLVQPKFNSHIWNNYNYYVLL